MFRLFAIISCFALALAYHVNPVLRNGGIHISELSSNNSTSEIGPFVRIHESFYYIETDLIKNWYDAYQTCNTLDSKLVAFETVEEWDVIIAYLIEKKLDSGYYWTQGIDLAKWGTHVWFSNNQTIPKEIYFAGEPNNNRFVEHCDTVGFRNTNIPRYGLNDEQCEYPFKYICETSEPNLERIIKYYV